MTTQCNLQSPLSLDRVNTILERLYADQESKPDMASVYNDAIKHYQDIKLSLQEGK